MPPPSDRSVALDALRGLAVLGMCFSGILPGGLPNFMYHGYYPQFLPEKGVFVEQPSRWVFQPDWPALTWVDVVFPAFLFALGAAIPLALAKRREASVGRAALHVLGRFGLLVAFAVYAKQVTAGFISDTPTTATWIVALLAMLPAAAVLTRLPRAWPTWLFWTIRGLGWAGAIGLLTWINHRREAAFSWGDHDIIILLLAHCYLVAALLWLALPRLGWVRILISLPLMLVAHHQAIGVDAWRTFGDAFDNWLPGNGWLRWGDGLLDLSPLWNATWYKFLWIVVPATLLGDWLLAMKPGKIGRPIAASLLLILGSVLAIIGLRHYGYGGWWPTPWTGLAALPPVAVAGWLVWRDGLLRRVWLYASITLAVGLLLAVLPAHDGWFEGGISKGPPSTLSWYLVSAGLSAALLLALTLWADVRRLPGLGGLALVGQNALLAYLGIRNLLAPIVAFGPNAWVASFGWSRWPMTGWAMVKTLALGVVVAGLTKLRVVWRV
jgi:predicted acyltransferase